MPKTESQMTREFCKTLEAAGAECHAIVGSMMQKSGLPDRYVASPIWTGWFEAKRDDNMMTPQQRLRGERLKERGVPVFIVRFIEKGMTRIGIYENGDEMAALDTTSILDCVTLCEPTEDCLSGLQEDGLNLLTFLQKRTNQARMAGLLAKNVDLNDGF